MITIGIVGGSGMTAAELIRIIIYHPNVKIEWIYSNSNSGRSISDLHNDLEDDLNLVFTNELNWNIDLVFLCLPHGASTNFLAKNDIPDTVKIIDLSRDFRNESEGFIYGLPELNKTKIRDARKIANPGCFATAIQLSILPLINQNIGDIHLSGITGSTGAGKSLKETSHFTWRNNNVSFYKILDHQHIPEVLHNIRGVAPSYNGNLHFIPIRGNFSRGILLSAYTRTDLKEEQIVQLYSDYYSEHPFVLITKNDLDLKQVINTNKAKLHILKKGNMVHISCAIDNLVKGASGQAIQNMNLMMKWSEKTGLNMKSLAY